MLNFETPIYLTKDMCPFELYGRLSDTDKITHHAYHRFFPQFLTPFQASATGIFEIGIEKKKSLQLWLCYFQKAFIYGMDINFSYETERVKIMQGDQSSLPDLQKITNEIKHSIQVIIDDGSHIPEHQWLSFNYLFSNLLEEGGVYIVEDIETSYWKNDGLYGYTTRYGYKCPRSFIEMSKKLIDVINHEFLNDFARTQVYNDLNLSQETIQSISSIFYGQNCVIITKKKKSEMELYDRKYRFYDKIV